MGRLFIKSLRASFATSIGLPCIEPDLSITNVNSLA